MNTIYFNIEKLIIIKKEETFYEQYDKESFFNGSIINYELLCEYLNKIIKKYKLNTSLFKNNINLVTSIFTTNLDIELIDNILTNNSFQKINHINEKELLKEFLNENNLFVYLDDKILNYYINKKEIINKLTITNKNNLEILLKNIKCDNIFLFSKNKLKTQKNYFIISHSYILNNLYKII